MSQQYGSSSPAPHGGNYQPGQHQASVGQEQHYTQQHSHQAHGGGYQPGQQGQSNGSHKMSEVTVTERGLQSDQISWEQQQQQQRTPIQRQVGYSQGNEVSAQSTFHHNC